MTAPDSVLDTLNAMTGSHQQPNAMRTLTPKLSRGIR